MASLNTEDILEQLKQLRQDLQQLHVELRTLRESKEMNLQMEELVKRSQPPDAQFAEEEKEQGTPETVKCDLSQLEGQIQEAENLWTQFPCYQHLLQEFRRIETTSYCNTLIVTGPKGCGKTSALCLLALQLRKENKKAYYIDLGMPHKVKDFLQQLKRDPLVSATEQPTLLIDNLQLFKSVHGMFRFDVGVYANVVAACVPGYDYKDIAPFRKERGDGKVRTVYFQPLNYDDALSLLRHTFPAKFTTVEAKSDSSERAFPIAGFAKEEFTYLMYVTGGIPRYLVEYLRTESHLYMLEELSRHFDDVLSKLSPEKVCELVVKIETTRVLPPNPLITHGIAYADKNDQVHIVSPKYLQFALQYNNLWIETRHDWQKLEMLIVFNLKFQICIVENCQYKKMELPTPTQFISQKAVGEISHELIDLEGGVALMKLAPGHPEVDLLLIDKRSKDTEVYFIQVSFSAYKNHKAKRKDLRGNDQILIGNRSVAAHYEESLKYMKEYFVYATTEFWHKGSDEQVYFLDLRRQVFHKVREF